MKRYCYNTSLRTLVVVTICNFTPWKKIRVGCPKYGVLCIRTQDYLHRSVPPAFINSKTTLPSKPPIFDLILVSLQLLKDLRTPPDTQSRCTWRRRRQKLITLLSRRNTEERRCHTVVFVWWCRDESLEMCAEAWRA